MTRMTIDFGIDLGTTNSAIAVVQGTDVKVFRNHLGAEYTPSAVWIDEKERLHVGQNAKDRLEEDADNAACEFKLLMGMEEAKLFRRSGKRLKPPELSAWVLKSLKRDVQRQTKEDIQAAVITIPAAFDAPQREATKRAAQLAGFAECPLLQEPVAAGLAHGFQSEKDNVYWLVYDLGGGTFDAAVIQMRGGEIQVLGHEGDNHLGGKKFDWDIVEKLFVPAIQKQYPRLRDFHRTNPRWLAAFAKLKWWAEEAKIKLSTTRSTPIHIDSLGEADGSTIRFDFELTRTDLEGLIVPYLVRTMNIGRKVLRDTRLSPADIEKVLLVGGPTQAPLVRQFLIEPTDGLGIPLDFRVDPMTVVVRGAAIFAGIQRRTVGHLPPPVAGTYTLDLEYKPVGTDLEPLVGGKIKGAGPQDYSGWTLEFVKSQSTTPWRSGKIEVLPDGRFLTSLWAEKGAASLFLIELSDPTGTPVPTVPERITYTHGNVFADPPLTHTLGIAMANNEVDRLFGKGTPLPCRGRCRHRTVHAVHRNQTDELLTIPVVEGENPRADRNHHIGSLIIASRNLKRDIPAGSEIEITVDVDLDHLIKVTAYLPIVDQEFPATISFRDYHKRSQNPEQLRTDIQQEKERLAQMRTKVRATGDTRSFGALRQIDDERMEQQVDDLHAASPHDPEAAAACQNRLLDLRASVDELEDALEWPELVTEAQESLRGLREVMEQFDTSQRARVTSLEEETARLYETRDPDMLRRKIREIDLVRAQILQEQPGFWVAVLEDLETRVSSMSDRSRAEQLLQTGRQARKDGNIGTLRTVVRQLIDLLPAAQQTQVRGLGGSTQN